MYQEWTLTEKVPELPGLVNRKIYEPSPISMSPTLCAKLASAIQMYNTLFTLLKTGILQATTAVSALVSTLALKSCIKFFVHIISLHLGLLVSPNLVYTFLGPPGQVVHWFQLVQIIFNSPWVSANSHPCILHYICRDNMHKSFNLVMAHHTRKSAHSNWSGWADRPTDVPGFAHHWFRNIISR